MLRTRILLSMLLVWFALAVTGFAVGGVVLAVRDYDMVTFLWWVLDAALTVLCFFQFKAPRYIMCGFLLIWLIMQSLNFLPFHSDTGIASYNGLFVDTHYLIPPSDAYVVPNTFHLVLVILVLTAFIDMSILMIKTIKGKIAEKGTNDRCGKQRLPF